MLQTRETTLVASHASMPIPIVKVEAVDRGCPSRFVQHETFDVVKLAVLGSHSYVDFTTKWVNSSENFVKQSCCEITYLSYVDASTRSAKWPVLSNCTITWPLNRAFVATTWEMRSVTHHDATSWKINIVAGLIMTRDCIQQKNSLVTVVKFFNMISSCP